MPQVSTKIYPIIKDVTQIKDYLINSSGTISLNSSSYTDLCFEFDISSIMQADSINLCIYLSKANIAMYSGFDLSKLKTYLKINSNAYSYDYNTYSTGQLLIALDSDAISYICSNDTLNVHIEPWPINYSGLKPATTVDLCKITTTVVAENSYIEYISIVPNVNNFTCTGTTIDEVITCSWTQEDVSNWKLEAIQNNVVKSTKTGTTNNSITFSPGDITSTGITVFKLTVYYGNEFKEYTQEVNLTGTQVKISSIEPNSIHQKLYNPIDIKVTGENMTNIVIECMQNGVIKHSNTISNNLLNTVTSTVLANTFTSGTVTLKVTATYQGTYYSNTTTQTVTFTTYGPPKTPVLDAQSEYATPSPLISWTLDSEQIEYEVTLNGVIVKDVYSSKINSYQCVDLSNNTYNTIKVRIKNSYNEWSDYAIATFLVSFAELEQPLIHAYSDVQNTCITIVFSSVEQEQFLKHAIYRKKSTETTWQKIKDNLSRESKYSDYCCGSGISYDYKVRALSSIGTFRDSEIVQASVTFSNRVLSVPGEDIFIELTGFETINDSLADIVFNSNSSYLGICGLTVPKKVSSTQKYKSFSCKCCFETQEAYENFLSLEEKEILLYRDGKGEAFYCTIQITGTTDSLEYYKYISFVVTETYYSGVEYDKPIYFGYSKREW